MCFGWLQFAETEFLKRLGFMLCNTVPGTMFQTPNITKSPSKEISSLTLRYSILKKFVTKKLSFEPSHPLQYSAEVFVELHQCQSNYMGTPFMQTLHAGRDH